MSDQQAVHYAIADGVATITIDRPERKNTLSVDVTLCRKPGRA